MQVTFRIVDTSEVGRVHAWHTEFAAANDAIFPRTEETFYRLTLNRQVWCAISDSDNILGLAYACVSDNESEVEIGGLMVSAESRGQGIGDILMRLPLAHFLVTERPLLWDRPPAIIAHALEGNLKPRNIISRAGFKHHRTVSIPSEQLPGLRTGADGNVHGEEFQLEIPYALDRLADWIDQWTGMLRDGNKATIELLPGEKLANWSLIIRSMI